MPSSRPALRPALVVLLTLALGAAPLAAVAGTDAVAAHAARPQLLGLTHYTGELHSHTGLTYPEQGGNLPTDVYSQLDSEGMDFFAATEKANGMDVTGADEFIDDPKDAESAEWRDLFAETDAWNKGGHNLVGVPSQEVIWWNGHSGHMNVFNADWLMSGESSGGGWNDEKIGEITWDLPAFYARLKQDPQAIAQFNHPSPTGYGTFDDFKDLDRQLDAQIETFEYKQEDSEYQNTWWEALDAGWHVAPTWSGDDHGKGFNDNPALTGIWAKSHDLAGLYDAMHRRSMYANFDGTAWMSLTGNGKMMGSILPSGTSSIDLSLEVAEPDDADPSGTVTFYGNGGAVLDTKTYSGRDATVTATVPVSNGDWVYAQVKQADGDLIISAPIWVGDTVRGADYAPTIKVGGPALRTVKQGQTIALPTATATDDSGLAPTLSTEVFTNAGLVPVAADGTFTVSSFDDYIAIIKATDANGNVGSEMVRYVVDQAAADPEAVFSHPEQIVNVGQEPGQAGISVVTDQTIKQTYVQVKKSTQSWSQAVTVASTGDKAFDIEAQGRPSPQWNDDVATDDVLRNQEFRLTGLDPGGTYVYRFALDPKDGWTGTRGSFTAGGFDNAPIYVLGDNQPADIGAPGDGPVVPADYQLFPQMLATLKQKQPGGDLLVQAGDLVNQGGFLHEWDAVFQYSLKNLGMQYAGVAGNHETESDPEHDDSIEIKRDADYSGMFANPTNGVIGESNYSFDRGDIHFAVINSMYDIDAQTQWLIDDMRSTDKKWRVVVNHFSPYGAVHAADPSVVEERAKLVPVLEQLGVDLYIGGHDHVYKREDMLGGTNATTDQDKLLGVNYVALGTAGPKFEDDIAEPWDDTVFDEKTQTGMVLQATDAGLEIDSYAIDGRQIDHDVITQPTDYWKVTSSDIRDGKLRGIGITSYPGAHDGPVTVTAAVYDGSEQKLLDLRTTTVTLKEGNGEQLVRFDTPITLTASSRVKAFIWDGLGTGEPLKDGYVVQEGVAGSGTPEDPYLIRTADDLAKISNNLGASYKLSNDITFDSKNRVTIGTETAPFTGVLDGDGHSITGMVTSQSGAMGLIGINNGTIRNLGVEDASLAFDQKQFGIVADQNFGTIEQVHTTGSISGRAQIGAITGSQNGTVRDSWSTASVTAQTRAGGIAGETLGNSVTEHNWYGGALAMVMISAAPANGGGITGVADEHSIVRNNAVLGAKITGKNSQAVAGQLIAGATLAENVVSASTTVGGPQRAGAEGAATIKGETVDDTTTKTADLYSGRLGWDFATVWTMDLDSGRPILVGQGE